MKRSKHFFVALFCLFALICGWGVTPVAANQMPYITVNELGNGFDLNGGRLDWGWSYEYLGIGYNAPVLTYVLPFSVTSGDVVLTEPETGLRSDIIRFDGNMLKFISEGKFDSPGSYNGKQDELADIPFPMEGISLLTGSISIPEFGDEGNNGAYYYPLIDGPGYIPGTAFGYNFISDTPVPLPPTILLLIPGLVGIAGLRRRIKK
ncbi:MAG: VPLPA-CTERM sorting domain-containing protein [Proteobacteria bacterium]|nr:VPLPA-CTERM sorting domain-containing protein [Pseudomonadota bacterium]